MSDLDDLMSRLQVAKNGTSPDRGLASSALDRLNNAASSYRNTQYNATPALAFAAWDRAVRALESLTGGGSGAPLDIGNIPAAEQRTNAAVMRAKQGQVVPDQVISSVDSKPSNYNSALNSAVLANDALNNLNDEMAKAQQVLDYLAVT